MNTTYETKLAGMHDDSSKYTCYSCGKPNNYYQYECKDCEVKAMQTEGE